MLAGLELLVLCVLVLLVLDEQAAARLVTASRPTALTATFVLPRIYFPLSCYHWSSTADVPALDGV
jgi:hypothetical protein